MPYIFLIPSYEPTDILIEILKSIPKSSKVVVVDDGSADQYNDIYNTAKKYAHVISYDVNLGKGHALKTGLNYIKENYNKYIVVTIDSDGQHKVSDALALCRYAKENLNTLVLGKREWGKDTPLRSNFGNALTRRIFNHLTKLNIYDTQTGLRAFSYKLTDYMLNIPGTRFEYEMNVLLGLKASKITYHEIPITTIYIDNNRKSHYKTFKDSYIIYKVIRKYQKNKDK